MAINMISVQYNGGLLPIILLTQCYYHRGTRLKLEALSLQPMCVCMFASHSFWTSMDVPAGVTQEEGHTGFLIHLLSVVHGLVFSRGGSSCSFPSSTVKSNFVYQRFNRSPPVEVLYLQPIIPPNKRFDIFPPDWGMLRRSRRVQICTGRT